MASTGMILVAEDNKNDAFLLERACRKAGIDAILNFVSDGQQAVDFLSGQGEGSRLPQLLLLDLKMPLMDGFDVLRWLRAQPGLKRLLVVVLTSSGEQKDIDRAYDLGANSYLVKPSSYEGLVDCAKLLDRYWFQANASPECVKT
jgi:CheY-like chemotaxis protein